MLAGSEQAHVFLGALSDRLVNVLHAGRYSRFGELSGERYQELVDSLRPEPEAA